ncbi:MAG: hypothetical protein IJ970_00620 [Mycoplasmataceae bacterium]|nr:hypothetical protein [Mycoplasmataceae bacterium]
MYNTYIHQINHNRYLKIIYSNTYKYSKLDYIKLFIKFDSSTITKLNILYIYFLFKNFVFKNGYFILVNKRSKKIIGMKFYLQHNLMYKFLAFIKTNFLIQPEVQNNIKLTSFDISNNYIFHVSKTLNYYLEKNIENRYYKNILNQFDMIVHFIFKHNTNLYDHIFYLNYFGFTFFFS